MESQVKERIVGAAVLVALGVWLIPWVLDGPEPAPETEAAPAFTLPSADEPEAPIRTETVEIDRGPQPLEDERSDAGREDAVAVALPAESASVPEAQTQPPPAAANDTPAAASAPAAVASGAWSVQLGAFGEMANAEQMASRVTVYGYTARVSDVVSGGERLHRVRVGGFDSEAQAEAAAGALAAHGFRVRVIPPEQ